MKNIKDLFDPETYTEKIKELAGKTTEIVTDLTSKLAGCFSSFGKGASDAFSLVAEKCSNTFSKMRKGLNKFNVSFKNSVKGFLAGGGAFTVMAMGAKSLFSLLDAGMKNLQQETLDLLDNLSDVFSQYEKMGKGQEKKAETNKSALSALESLQLQDDPLNNEQRLNSEKYIETLKKSYQDLNVEIDETTGKIKNFEEIQASAYIIRECEGVVVTDCQFNATAISSNSGNHSEASAVAFYRTGSYSQEPIVYNSNFNVSASASATPSSSGYFYETEQACGFYDSSGCHDPCHHVYRTKDGTTDYCNS